MADCESCYYYSFPPACSDCENGSNFERVVFTNADEIRAMSDEELATFLTTFKNTFGEEYEGEMSCLDWLQSETN